MAGITFGEEGSVPGTSQAAGDAGQNLLKGILSAPMDADAAKRISTGGADLKKMAENGSFAINEAGLQAYLKACDKFLEGYDTWRDHLRDLVHAAQMGDSKYAKDVANFNAKVAGSSGDPQSLLPNLDLMHDGIEAAKAALLIARKNYRETEEAHNITFAKINKELDPQ
ncbi:hypothetical protein ACFWY9_35165 [Amycolatopsis sp. NPDC059027]|uniref:hypothetical protein n=1 Tax=Amycolatopsis sp. NPDC059027 TaxID=3346709 RepID=UPI00366A6AF6